MLMLIFSPIYLVHFIILHNSRLLFVIFVIPTTTIIITIIIYYYYKNNCYNIIFLREFKSIANLIFKILNFISEGLLFFYYFSVLFDNFSHMLIFVVVLVISIYYEIYKKLLLKNL